MNFECNRNALKSALSSMSKIVSGKTTKPILKHILFEAENDHLRISASNENQKASAVIDCQQGANKTKVAFAAPFEDFNPYLSKGKSKDVSFHYDGAQVTIRNSKRSLQSFGTLPADEFPEVSFPGSRRYSVDAEKMKALLNVVDFAATKDESRYYLMGVFLQIHGGKVCAAATNGHMLAFAQSESLHEDLANMPALNGGLIIPSKGVELLCKSLEQNKPTCDLWLDREERPVLLAFGDDSAEQATLFVQGTYPDFRAVLPKPESLRNFGHLVFDRKELIDAINIATLASPDAMGGMAFDLAYNQEQEKGHASISAKNAGKGRNAKELVEYELFDPNKTPDFNLNIGFNGTYIVECLSALRSQKVVLSFSNERSPMMIREIEKDENGQEIANPQIQHLVMPMQL